MLTSSCTWMSVTYELQSLLPIEILEPRTVELASKCMNKKSSHRIYALKRWVEELASSEDNVSKCVPKSAKSQKPILLYNYRNGKGVQSKQLRIICEKYRIKEMHDTCM